MKLVWRCAKTVPHLHIAPGDLLVYQPDNRRYPYMVCRPVKVDPGAIMAAEFAGDIAPFSLTPDSPAGAQPCRVLEFPAQKGAQSR